MATESVYKKNSWSWAANKQKLKAARQQAYQRKKRELYHKDRADGTYVRN